MILEATKRLIQGASLAPEETEAAIDEIMTGQAAEVQIAAFLTALAARGVTAAEVVGAARAMRRHSLRLTAVPRPLVDTCGTGGDNSGTFNISTAAALVVAGAGVPVAKHGNRSATSRCGSAEVLEALGVPIEMPPALAERALHEVGMAFLYAPLYHPSMRFAAPVRKALGFPTIFNLLGPLTNPAGADRQLIGVARPELLPLLAEALAELGTDGAVVVHGAGGVDELTLVGPAEAFFVNPSGIHRGRIDPGELGFAYADLAALRGGDSSLNRQILSEILQGRDRGPRRDVVLLNAAAALWVAGVAEDLRAGVELARRSIDQGAAWAKLEGLRRLAGEAVV